MSEYKVKIIRNISEIDSIRCAWQEMQLHPNTDFDQYISVIKTLNHVISPYILMLSRNNQTKAMAVGRLENTKINFSLGFQ